MKKRSVIDLLVYIFNLTAVGLLVILFLYGWVYVENSYKETIASYSFFDLINKDSNIISMGAIVIFSLVTGILLWHNRKTLSQILISGSVLYSFFQIQSAYESISFENDYHGSISILGEVLLPFVFLLTIASTVLFLCQSSKESKKEN